MHHERPPPHSALFATNQVPPDTERNNKYQLRNFAEWMHEDRDVDDMMMLLLSTCCLPPIPASSSGFNAETISGGHQVVLRVGTGRRDNPAALLKLPRAVGNRAPVFLTLDETRLLLNTAKLPRAFILFPSLAYRLRIAEVPAQEIDDITPPTAAEWVR